MVNKRPFDDEDSCGVACKHPRQMGHADQLHSSGNFFPCSDAPQTSRTLDGKGEDSSRKSQDERIGSDSVTEVLNEAEKEIDTPGGLSTALWINGSVDEEDIKSEPAYHLSFFPEFFEFDPRVREFVQSDDCQSQHNCSSVPDYPSRMLVSVGPDHQAYVPEWDLSGFKNSLESLNKSDLQIASSKTSNSGLKDDDESEQKMGICVIPMPDMEASPYSLCEGEEKSNCNCLDGGSILCTRQHIQEAREKLRENLGSAIFEKLGICDMGEEVAKKWTEEEEQAFHETVLSNPASLGMNFWDRLSAIFPSRTKQDLVSYYFNVFMLRKRTEQNRYDPLNIDSDNDEWQIDEFGGTEEEDSVVESPIDQDFPVSDQDHHEENCLEDIEDVEDIDAFKDYTDTVNSRQVTGEEDGGDIDDASETGFKNFFGDRCFYSDHQRSGKIPASNRDDTEIQDDSCTSYEYQYDRVDQCGPVDLGTDMGDFSRE